MSQQNDSGFLSIVAGAARSAFLRVYNSSGTWTTAGATTMAQGVQLQPSLAATDNVAIKACNGPGTVKMTASEAISEGATVYAAASGTIATSGTIVEGIAMEAATASGDIIEVLPVHSRDVSTAIAGTTAAAFEVDNDASTPKIALSGQSAGTGDYTTTMKPEATLSADNAIIVPEADGDVLAAIALAQTLTNKTLGLGTRFTVDTVAAAGSAQGDAGALTADAVNIVTGADGTKGVVLPAAVAGSFVVVYNPTATNALPIYPGSSDDINDGTADAAVETEGKTLSIFFAVDATTWGAIYTANS